MGLLTIASKRNDEKKNMDKLVKAFLKRGGKITVGKPGKHVKTFKR